MGFRFKVLDLNLRYGVWGFGLGFKVWGLELRYGV